MQASSSVSSSPVTASLEQIFQNLFKVKPETLKDEMTMADIELWDSLHHIELVVALEEAFGFELTFEEISRLQSIGAIRQVVAEKTAK